MNEVKNCGNCKYHFIDPSDINRCSEKNGYNPYVDDLNFVCNYWEK